MKPKIIWKRIGSILRFSYDEESMFGLDSTCFATGKHIMFLTGILNSNMGMYLLKDSPKTGTGDLLVSVQALEPIKVPYSMAAEEQILQLVDMQLDSYSINIENELNSAVYSLFRLTSSEIDFVEKFVTQFQQNQ